MKSIILFFLCAIYTPFAIGLDTSEEEKTCKDIGFTKGTEGFGNCVLELYGRKSTGSTRQSNTETKRSQPTVRSEPVVRGDGSQGDRTCQSYGYKPGTGGYSDCRMQIDMATQRAQQEQQRYQAELRLYQQQLAAAKKARRRELGLKQLEMGLGMMSGRYSSGTNTRNIPPPAPPVTNSTIRLPNGNQIYCQTVNNYTSCR